MSYLRLNTIQRTGKALLQSVILRTDTVIVKALYVVATAFVITAGAALLYPFDVDADIKAISLEGNYYPVTFSAPVEVVQHQVTDGSVVLREQVVTIVHPMSSQLHSEKAQQLTSAADGIYFSMVAAGEKAVAMQPVAKVLRSNDTHLYFFAVSNQKHQSLKAGQWVELSDGNVLVRGRTHSVIRGADREQLNVGIQLEPPFDTGVLHPLARIRLTIIAARDNGSVRKRGEH